jgi:hypothetical protein
MGTQSLLVHILIHDKNALDGQTYFFVYLEGAEVIQRLRRILSVRANEKAMMYALTKGRQVDPGEVSASRHLILTKTGAYWDLM